MKRLGDAFHCETSRSALHSPWNCRDNYQALDPHVLCDFLRCQSEFPCIKKVGKLEDALSLFSNVILWSGLCVALSLYSLPRSETITFNFPACRLD